MINDYTPFMDLYPELKLLPTSDFKNQISGISDFDYIQDVNRTDSDGKLENFHLIVKDRKFGIYLYSSGCVWTVDEIVLSPEFDYPIVFTRKEEMSFSAIIKKNGKYGMLFWNYGFLKNKFYAIKTEYDSIEKLNETRYKAIKGNTVVYFDRNGQILK